MYDLRAPTMKVRPYGIPAGEISHSEVQDFLLDYPGFSVQDGLFRVHCAGTGGYCSDAVAVAFPEYSGNISLFGYDWLGRQFGIDSRRADQSNGAAFVVMFDIGGGEVLEPPLSFEQFVADIEPVAEPAFSLSFYREWRLSNPAVGQLPAEQCVGYRTPLFLRGPDTVANLEVIDLDVYVTLTAQMRAQTRGLPTGTTISFGK